MSVDPWIASMIEERIPREIYFHEAKRLGPDKVWTLDPGALDPIRYFTYEPTHDH